MHCNAESALPKISLQDGCLLKVYTPVMSVSVGHYSEQPSNTAIIG